MDHFERQGGLDTEHATAKKKINQLNSGVNLFHPFSTWTLQVPGSQTNQSICLGYFLDLDTLETGI